MQRAFNTFGATKQHIGKKKKRGRIIFLQTLKITGKQLDFKFGLRSIDQKSRFNI